MRRSELSEYIKETIVELLSEATPEEVDAQADLNKELEKTVALSKELSEDEDAEPSKAELGKTKSLAKTKEELAKVISIMKDVVADWKKSEGKEKEDLLTQLKVLTASKKKLEKKLEKLL
jgi:hypothetical protein